MTRNLTMAFDDDMLAKLRVYAAERNTTVNAIFRKHAEALVGGDRKRREARDWMVARAKENMVRDTGPTATDTGAPSIWSREETYAERLDRWPTGGR